MQGWLKRVCCRHAVFKAMTNAKSVAVYLDLRFDNLHFLSYN